MYVHEFEAKRILQKYGVPIPEQVVVENLEEVREAIIYLGIEEAVIKAQVHAGGRGKAGGVKIAKNRSQILQYAKDLLGKRLVTPQTGKEGIAVHKLLISPLTQIKKEYYLGAAIDRNISQATLIASKEGGMEIEEAAAQFPEKLIRVPIGLDGKIARFRLVDLAKQMGWSKETALQGMKIAAGLALAFVENDALLLEINPLAETPEGELLALDAKLSLDENALFRHPELKELEDPSQLREQEAQAKAHDLAYVGMDGTIGCMVNGAGLAMATMDLITYCGGRPANFLDVGGGASQGKIAEGFKILLTDPHVKVIFLNIFGGILNCVTLAGGIVAAAGDRKVDLPIVVRMLGTHVEEGKRMLANSGLGIIVEDDLLEAAKKAVAFAKE